MSKIKITKSSGNVFKDLGFSENEAANLLIRADLVIAIREYIRNTDNDEQRDFAKAIASGLADLNEGKQFDIETVKKKLGLQ